MKGDLRMYYVTTYLGELTATAKFDTKDKAIKYFNIRSDQAALLKNCDYIEISDDNGLILFDYEVK